MAQSIKIAPSIRFKHLLNMLPVIGLLFFYFTHYLEGTYSFIIPLVLVSLWFVLSLATQKVNGILMNKVCVWWMVYLFVCVVMVILGQSSTNLNFIISRLSIYLIPAIGYFIVHHYNRKEKIIILTLFFVVYFANLLQNILLGFQLPDIFEEQESTEESIKLSILMNIATTGFIVVGYWLIGTLLMAILIVKDNWWRVLCLILIVPIAYYMLFQNTRGIAILLLMVEMLGFFLAFFEPIHKRSRRSYYLFSSVLLVFLVLMVFVPLLGWLVEYLHSDRLAERFNDLVDFRQSGGDLNSVRDGSFTQRILLAQTSLNSFFSSIISLLIGIGDHTQSFGGDLVKSGVGGHSEFIDVLARYGLIGAFVFWKIMKNYYRMLCQLTTKREVLKYVNVIFVVIVLSGVLNNIFSPNMLFFIFLIFPIVIEFTNHKISQPNGR